MTIRELIKFMIETSQDLDLEVQVRIHEHKHKTSSCYEDEAGNIVLDID